MRVLVGTSGYSYKEWKGPFYPADIDNSGMLAFYGSRLPTVEINNTFYRVPKLAVIRSWAAQVPDGFRFVLKASRRITHQFQLAGAADVVSFHFRMARELGDKFGALLFQLPPHLTKDAPRLETFCAWLPRDARVTFEFREPSWYCDEVYDILRKYNAALCGGDPEEVPDAPPIVSTADFGYLRLRRDDYSDEELAQWSERIVAQPWSEAFVFFKHETMGPLLALALDAVCGGRPRDLAKVSSARPGVAAVRNPLPDVRARTRKRRSKSG
jgi:uncharacterized protein YecE (DUF72 family)